MIIQLTSKYRNQAFLGMLGEINFVRGNITNGKASPLYFPQVGGWSVAIKGPNGNNREGQKTWYYLWN